MRLIIRIGYRVDHRGLDRKRKAALFDLVRLVVVHRIDGRVNRDVRACARYVLRRDQITARDVQVLACGDIQTAIQ
jgi:hypothetical protein